MTDQEKLDKLRFPIGKFAWVANLSKEAIEQHIQTLKAFPQQLQKTLENCDENFLLKQYRPGGWTVAQVVNHLADSHMHSYLRFKHAILEDTPAIKDYEEKHWAELSDASDTDIQASINILTGIHKRWTRFLTNLTLDDFKRGYFHPERSKIYPLETAIALYAWHCKHHLAHIMNIKNDF